MRLLFFLGLVSLPIFFAQPVEDHTTLYHKRAKRQFSIDDLIHRALSLVRPIFDTSQPIQNDAMINEPFNDGSEGMRRQNVLGTRPISILDGIPLCKGNSRICEFISCEAENFKQDENFANLNLAAQVLGDKKLRKAVSSNPDAINAVCTEQGMSESQCKIFSKGFQIVDRFITTVEGDEPQPLPPLPEEEELEEPTQKSTKATTTTTETSAIIQREDDEPVFRSVGFGSTAEPGRTHLPPIGPPKLPLRDDPPKTAQRVRIEMGPGRFDDDLVISADHFEPSNLRKTRKLLGSKTWSSQPIGNSIEPDPIDFEPIVAQVSSPFVSSLPSPAAIAPPFGPPGHFLFPTVPPSLFSLPTFSRLPTLPPLPLLTLPTPATPATFPVPFLPMLSIQPMKSPGLTVEKPIVQFSKDSYASVFRQSNEKFSRRIRQVDESDLDFDDIQWSNRRVKRDYYENLGQARRNLGLGGSSKTSVSKRDPEEILGEKSEGDDYYTQTEEAGPKKSKFSTTKRRDCLALLG